MRGSPRTCGSNLLLIALLFIIGCAGAKRSSEEAEQREPTGRDFLLKYEPQFDPARYDPDLSVLQRREEEAHSEIGSASVVTAAAPETISGFRIQVLLTQEIDEASSVRDSLNDLLPDDWVYVVYDSPYYKVRVGDYHERPEANALLKRLIGKGFRGAWIVPDNVIKNPPPKLPDEFIVPERPFNQR
jgi:hypothetical protein